MQRRAVSIMRTCAHIRCVNSMVLKLAGIDRNTPDPPGGEIERDENGEPTGVLKENARNLLAPLLPRETAEQKTTNLLELGDVLTSQGITAICDMGNLDETDNMPIYEAAAEKGFRQKVGVYYMWDFFADNPDFHIPDEWLDRSRQIFRCRTQTHRGREHLRADRMDEPPLLRLHRRIRHLCLQRPSHRDSHRLL